MRNPGLTDGNGNITQTKETYAAANGQPANIRTHTKAYDSFNRLERQTDPWGDTLIHTYDAQGNQTGTTAQGSTTRNQRGRSCNVAFSHCKTSI